jgi:hypothetical protein
MTLSQKAVTVGLLKHSKSWPQLADEIAHAVRVDRPSSTAKSAVWKLRMAATCAICRCSNGSASLWRCLPRIESRILYLDHLVERGRDLYDLACQPVTRKP